MKTTFVQSKNQITEEIRCKLVGIRKPNPNPPTQFNDGTNYDVQWVDISGFGAFISAGIIMLFSEKTFVLALISISCVIFKPFLPFLFVCLLGGL